MNKPLHKNQEVYRLKSIQTQANLAALIAEFKTLKADFKYNQSNMKNVDETFQQKV